MNTFFTHTSFIARVRILVLLVTLSLGMTLCIMAQETPKAGTEQKPLPCPIPQKATLNAFQNSSNEQCTEPLTLAIDTFNKYPSGQRANAVIGDQINVVIFIVNDANEKGLAAETVAKNLRLATTVDTSIGKTHPISVSFRGDNTNTVESTVYINTHSESILQIVQSSGRMFDGFSPNPVNFYFNVGNNVISFGDLPPGYSERFYVIFSVAVVDPTIANSPSNQNQLISQAMDMELPIVSKARRRRIFEEAWQLVNDNYYDPAFGGLDWKKIRSEYTPRIDAFTKDDDAYDLIQEMFNRLHRSHLEIIPPFQNNNEEASPNEAGERNGDIYGVGIDLRLIDDVLVVTRVDPKSSAEKAGLRPGFAIETINEISVDKIISRMTGIKGYGESIRTKIPKQIRDDYFKGSPETFVTLSYRDERDLLRTAKIPYEKLQGNMTQPIGNSPSDYLEFESKMLKQGVGYIRFNVFRVPVMEKLCAALHDMRDTASIIIDLRGNGGGASNVTKGIAALLEPNRVVYGEIKGRQADDKEKLEIIPGKFHYRGRVVVLIDELSFSASELLAYFLKESKRALIIGNSSSGYLLGANYFPLFNGASVQIPVNDFVTPSGESLEGKGVTPNIGVTLTRASLLKGIDDQLEVAIGQAQNPQPRAEINKTRAQVAAVMAQPVPTPSSTPPPSRQSLKADEGYYSPYPEPSRIIEDYIQAIGGRAALAKITSRVAKGKITSSDEITGDIAIYQRLPNKLAIIKNVNGEGVSQEGFDGHHYWALSPYGLRETEDAKDFSPMMLFFDLNGINRMKELYPKMTFIPSESGQSELYKVKAEAADGSYIVMLFHIKSKLLVAIDNTYFNNFREVNGVLLPFIITSYSSQEVFETITLEKIEHNVSIDDQKLAQLPSCFAQ